MEIFMKVVAFEDEVGLGVEECSLREQSTAKPWRQSIFWG